MAESFSIGEALATPVRLIRRHPLAVFVWGFVSVAFSLVGLSLMFGVIGPMDFAEVAAETVAVGAIILVRPGDRVPADGEIIEGAGDLDEAPVTGESVPKRKVEGDPVFAGTINGGSVLRVRVTASASDNTIARVVRLVEEA